MHNLPNTSSVHSGNYYRIGTQRVLSKLADMRIAVPKEAVSVPEGKGTAKSFSAEFTRIEHAIMDWFEGRDYRQAQALIHFRPPTSQWQTIVSLNGCTPPGEISPGMVCPSRMDALAAVVAACDLDVVRLDACRKDGDALVVVINGAAVLRIEPIVVEPFDRDVRERVRTALKGVREGDEEALAAHAGRLPGFKEALASGHRPSPRIRDDGCMLLGFPGNWVLAMRNALKQAGIIVKQSQAQELAAVFFGAGHWHQLVKHQDELNEGNAPVAVDVEGQRRFYWTSEEALFATGKALEVFPEPVVIKSFGLSVMGEKLIDFSAARKSAVAALPPGDWFLCPSSIAIGSHEYWSVNTWDETAAADAARRLLAAIDASELEASTLGVLYADSSNTDVALLESLLGRQEIPPEQIVYVGDHVLAVSYVPEPDGGPRLAAYLQVFQITSDGVRRHERGGVAMYKAEVRVVRDNIDGTKLMIRADYGRDEPIVISVASMSQVERLVALTHRKDLFMMEPVGLGEDAVLQLH